MNLRSAVDFETAFDRYYPALYRYLHRLTGDADMAEDVAQESFLRLLEREVPEEGVRSWLFTVGTNLVRDRTRTRSRRRRLLEAEDYGRERSAGPDEQVERKERVQRVRAALDELKPRDRKILLLREEGFRYAEIAEMIGVKASSVGTLLARALRRFEEAYRGPEAREGRED